MSAKERPILFSGPMVRAILEGRKTVTRRLLNERGVRIDLMMPTVYHYSALRMAAGRLRGTSFMVPCDYKCGKTQHDLRGPYGVPGDRLWVKETFWHYGEWVKDGRTKKGKQRWRFRPHDLRPIAGVAVLYDELDAPKLKRTERGYHKRPSIFMPRWASRITLEVKSVRVERLQEITEEDARAEGAPPHEYGDDESLPVAACRVGEFITLWDSINGKRASWASNPFVWRISFRRVGPDGGRR